MENDMTLTWMITGANRGIGLEFVRQLTAAGDRVVAVVRDPGAATQLTALASENQALTIEQADMDDRASIAALAVRLTGVPIDILFNNAGLYGGSWDNGSHRQSAASMDYALWEKIMRVNVMAPFQMIQAVLPNLLLGQRKLVINMSSDLGSITNNAQGQSYAYRSSKAALNMVTKGLSVELAGEGVSVISMAPGWTQTDLGGSQAQWSVQDSVANQRKVIAGLTAADNGRFVDLLGADVPW
jgi:NAD(P)-dependent dehydrogenase (short-subunit alcohol dehydrogenase family)